MDRYWISREIHRRNKVIIPSVGDLDKYSKVEKDKYTPELIEKAEICHRIVTLHDPDCKGDELIQESAKLMQEDIFSLKRILDSKLKKKKR